MSLWESARFSVDPQNPDRLTFRPLLQIAQTLALLGVLTMAMWSFITLGLPLLGMGTVTLLGPLRHHQPPLPACQGLPLCDVMGACWSRHVRCPCWAEGFLAFIALYIMLLCAWICCTLLDCCWRAFKTPEEIASLRGRCAETV